MCLIEVGGRTFAAIGSFAQIQDQPSLFVFVVLPITIGGPPYFFVVGLAGGFGYHRGFLVPDVAEVDEFALVTLADPDAVVSDPWQALESLGGDFPVLRGSYWFAAGVRFTSFGLITSMAIAYVLLDQGFEVGLLGRSVSCDRAVGR